VLRAPCCAFRAPSSHPCTYPCALSPIAWPPTAAYFHKPKLPSLRHSGGEPQGAELFFLIFPNAQQRREWNGKREDGLPRVSDEDSYFLQGFLGEEQYKKGPAGKRGLSFQT
jgi:hypothetical protein